MYFYEHRKFFTAFSSARQRSLLRSVAHTTPWRSILILFCHLCLDISSCLSISFLHQNPISISPFSPYCHTPHPFHSARFDRYRTCSSSLRSILHSPVTSSLLSPNFFLSPLLSNPQFVFLPFGESFAQYTLYVRGRNPWRCCNTSSTGAITSCRP